MSCCCCYSLIHNKCFAFRVDCWMLTEISLYLYTLFDICSIVVSRRGYRSSDDGIFHRFLVKEWSVAPSMLKWEWSRAEANASDRSLEEIGCWCDYSHYHPWVPRGYRSSDDGILTPILGGKWFVAPSMLKWEWARAEANASNRPIDEIGCWRACSHYHPWVPRGYGSSGDGHCSFLKATPRESKRRRRGEVDRTCHLPENLVILEIK